jgi:hypothetical protein
MPQRAEILYDIAPQLNFSKRTTQLQESMEKHKKTWQFDEHSI